MNLPDPTDFIHRPCQIGGDDCTLIFPNHIGATWTPENLNFRSVIVRNSDKKRISCGYTKFFNNLEKPHLYPNPEDFQDWTIEDKLDGSNLIVSSHNTEPIVRTRGTASVNQHGTAPEIWSLVQKYNILAHPCIQSEKYTFLFEHITPNLPIVIRYDEPDIILLSIIENDSYRYLSHVETDKIAKEIGVRRPERFTFGSIKEIIDTAKHLKGREGFVLSYNNNQNRVKIKADHYLSLHRLKESLNSFDKVVDYYFASGMPSYAKCMDNIEKTFDFEIAKSCRDDILKICHGMKMVDENLAIMKIAIESLRVLSRKDAALKIIENYKATDLTGIAFKLLNNKELTVDDYKKMLYQNIGEKS